MTSQVDSHTKRILILNYEYPPLGGGAANATQYLVRELTKQTEWTIDLVTSSTDAFEIQEVAPHIRIHKLDIGKHGNIHYQSMKDLLTYARKSYTYCKQLKREHAYNGIHAFFGIPSGLVALLLKLPYIVSLRGSDVPFYNRRFKLLDTLVFSWLSKIIWKRASAVIANSAQLKELALQTAPNQQIGVIYNGVDTEEFTPADSSATNKERLQIISTSRLIERKGVHFLVDAVISLLQSKQPVDLHIVGSGDMEEQMKKTVAEAQAGDHITFYGAVNHDKLARMYMAADIFVLPSLNEGMSNSMLEAMASGLAIVATDTGGTAELLTEQNSILVQPENAEELYAALSVLLQDKSRLTEMKKHSRMQAEQMNWSSMCTEYMTVYEQL